MSIENFKDFKFRKVSQAKRDQLFLHLMYAGGDADTEHPVDIPLNIKFSEYKQHLKEINQIIDRYKRLKKVLKSGSDINYNSTKKAYFIDDIYIDDDIQDLVDHTPNDPQSDYQFKCYLDSIILIGYDENGDKHESYV